jgi:hypothetical protein
MDKAAT